MRLKLAAAVVVLTLAIVPALAQTDVAPSNEPVTQTEAPATAPAAPKKRIRYVNEKGETLICKTISGGTGTRLRNRGKIICGTQTQWDDQDSEINQLFDNMIQSNTPTGRG